jgi:Competence protein CoiA-like family
MPLRAFIDGHEVIAPLVREEEWQTLRRKVRSKIANVQMACCKAKGHLRISKLDTKHFVHTRGVQCDWAPETLYHLRAKQEIIEACHEAGFEARPEVSGTDWRADVLATKGNVRIAFEVQWSNQTEEETRERQLRYEKVGIRCCWFMRKPPEVLVEEPIKAIPVFQLSVVDDKLLQVSLNRNTWPLYEFTKSLLSKRIRYCTSATLDSVQRVTIVFYETSCWRCGNRSHMYYLDEPYRTRCGISRDSIEGLAIKYSECPEELTTEIVAAVEKFLISDEVLGLRVGKIKRRFSRTAGRSYNSFGCPKCDAIFGEWYRRVEQLYAGYEKENAPAIFQTEVSCRPISAPHTHWCFPNGSVFCDGE